MPQIKTKVAIFLTESQPFASYDFVFAGTADTFVKSDNKNTHISKLKHCRYITIQNNYKTMMNKLSH